MPTSDASTASASPASIITMSQRELSRAQVMQRLQEGRLGQAQAAAHLHLSVRQVKRLWRAYDRQGARALISRRRGQPSNNQLPPQLKEEALHLIRSHYPDFGPTLAHEKLSTLHHLRLSRESVRQLMIAEALWHPKRARKPVIHQMRQRRACLGELVQIDGSPHAWFEDRAPACTLLVFIDDATGRLLQLWFAPAETTWSYFAATKSYLQTHGKPLAFYSDKDSVFRVAAGQALGGSGLTQFGRAMQQLQIEIICANTPQAKGRVERANQTLQDRLIKEMRLQGISTIEAANLFVPHFAQELNERFAVVPRNSHNAHRPLATGDDLERIFTLQESRSLSKNLTLQYRKVIYQIQTTRPSYALRRAKVQVCEQADGHINIEYRGKDLPYSIYQRQERQAEVVEAKQVNSAVDALPLVASLVASPAAQRAKPASVQAARTGHRSHRSPSLRPDHPWHHNSLFDRSRPRQSSTSR
jgi:hypothetical protein